MGSGEGITPEELFKNWERADYIGDVIGTCNAIIADEGQFIKFVTVQEPPPRRIKIPLSKVGSHSGPMSAPDEPFRTKEFELKHLNYRGWIVYG